VSIETKIFGKSEKSKALFWLEQKQREARLGIYQESKNYSLEELFDLYRGSKRWFEITAYSRCYFNKCHKNFLLLDRKWLDIPIKDLNVHSVTRMFEDMKKVIPRKRKNLAREIDYISICIGYYHDSIDPNFQSPITNIHKYEYGKLTRKAGKKNSNTVKVAFDKDKVKSLFDDLLNKGSNLPQYEVIYYYIAKVQFILGLRLGEACGLEWSDIDFDRKMIRLTGTMLWYGENGQIVRNHKVSRLKEEGDLEAGEAIEYLMFPSIETLFKEIKSLNRSDRWVMANKQGDVPQYSKIYQRLSRTGCFEEVGQCSHKLRKTAKTLGQAMMGSEISKNLLRHSSDAVSNRYVDESVLSKHNPLPELLAEITSN
jgi:integrase